MRHAKTNNNNLFSSSKSPNWMKIANESLIYIFHPMQLRMRIRFHNLNFTWAMYCHVIRTNCFPNIHSVFLHSVLKMTFAVSFISLKVMGHVDTQSKQNKNKNKNTTVLRCRTFWVVDTHAIRKRTLRTSLLNRRSPSTKFKTVLFGFFSL